MDIKYFEGKAGMSYITPPIDFKLLYTLFGGQLKTNMKQNS